MTKKVPKRTCRHRLNWYLGGVSTITDQYSWCLDCGALRIQDPSSGKGRWLKPGAEARAEHERAIK